MTSESIHVTIQCGSGENPQTRQTDSFDVPAYENQTVLDVVSWVQQNAESTLSYRFACRVGMCGSCAMMDHYEVATEDRCAMCGDTGVPRWFVKFGNEASVEGGMVALEAALRRATANATRQWTQSVWYAAPLRQPHCAAQQTRLRPLLFLCNPLDMQDPDNESVSIRVCLNAAQDRPSYCHQNNKNSIARKACRHEQR